MQDMINPLPSSIPIKATSRALVAWCTGFSVLTGLAIMLLWLTGVDPTKDFSPAIIIISYSPALAALAIAGFLQGIAGVTWLLRQLITWRIHIVWYAFALLTPLVLVYMANILCSVFGGQPMQWGHFSLESIAIGPLIAGSFGEELGWRGFAQPLLQRRYSIFWASVIIGLLWATWHLYPIFSPGGQEHLTVLTIGETYLRLVSTAVLYGWLYNMTGSLLVVMLAHAGHNIAIDILGASEESAVIIAILYFLAAASVVALARKELFSRPK